MTPTDFSVLLLAWDDADPGVAVLGGSALPPTLPLVYQLVAARQPVLAVYPHLPAAPAEAAPDAAGPVSATAAALPAPAWPEPGVIPNPLAADTNGPGVRLLPTAEPPGSSPLLAPASGSRLVGLDDLQPTIQGALPTSHSLSLTNRVIPGPGNLSAATGLATAGRSQWPALTGPPRATWQAPAAPYAGAAAAVQARPASAVARVGGRVREAFPPPPPAPPRPADQPLRPAASDAEAPDALATQEAADASESSTTEANTILVSSAPDSDMAVPAPFDEPVEEIGAAEASDLDAPEDDLVPDAAGPTAPAGAPSEAPATAAEPAPAATWAVRQPTLDGLNFRMIQYARQAAQLVDGREDFDVVYAPGWPAWLAALEIRNRSGRPLVLYVPALASDTAPAAERGWLLGLERMALRRARLVLVPDADVLRQLRARHAEALGEARIVPADDETAVQLVLAEVALGE